jgi:peptidyl-tRNA hydrolase, PTH2 family
MDFEYKMVIVTRSDLCLSAGKLAAQVAHAAVCCALSTKKNNSKWFSHWQNRGAKKAVVKVNCFQDFISLKLQAQKLNIATAMIEDAGLTEIPSGTITVLGIGPAPSNIIDQVTGSLSLL